MKILEGKRIFLMVSEPWRFGTLYGCGPFEAKVISERDDALIIQLTHPVHFDEQNCEYFIAQPRYDEKLRLKLQGSGSIIVGLTHITSEIALGPHPFDLSSWRGGVGLIGSLHITKPKSK